MSRVAAEIKCTNNDIKILNNIIGNTLSPDDLKKRCRAILLAAEGLQNKDIAQKLKVRPNSVCDWRKAWMAHGIDGLVNIVKTGRPRSEGRKLAEKELGSDQTASITGISEKNGISRSTVYRAAMGTGSRTKTLDTALYVGCKALSIVGLYVSNNERTIVLRSSDHMAPTTSKGSISFLDTEASDEVKEQLAYREGIDLIEALELMTAPGTTAHPGKNRHDMRQFLGSLVPSLPQDANDQYHVIYYSPMGSKAIGTLVRTNLHTIEARDSADWISEVAFWMELLGGDSAYAGKTADAIREYMKGHISDGAAFRWHSHPLREADIPSSDTPSFEDDNVESILTIETKIENRDGTVVTATLKGTNLIPAATSVNYTNALTLGDSIGSLDTSLGSAFRTVQKELMEKYLNEAVKKTAPKKGPVRQKQKQED